MNTKARACEIKNTDCHMQDRLGDVEITCPQQACLNTTVLISMWSMCSEQHFSQFNSYLCTTRRQSDVYVLHLLATSIQISFVQCSRFIHHKIMGVPKYDSCAVSIGKNIYIL